jgi:hypothetical protein
MGSGAARECIPDAIDGAAPGLEIRGRIGRLRPSDDDTSVALTSLTNKGLEGIPIAQRLLNGKLVYLDTNGPHAREITKVEAMGIAGGIVYYQHATDPSKGRLRLRGSFVSEDGARTIVSESRAASDVADLRDLDNLGVIDEEWWADDVETGRKPWCIAPIPCLLLAILLMSALGSLCSATREEALLLESPTFSATPGYETQAHAYGDAPPSIKSTEAESKLAKFSESCRRVPSMLLPVSIAVHVAAVMALTSCICCHLCNRRLAFAFSCAIVAAYVYLARQLFDVLLDGTKFLSQLES